MQSGWKKLTLTDPPINLGLGIVQIIARSQRLFFNNSSFVFRTIGENPVGLAKRLDSFDYLGRFLKISDPHAEICLYGAVMLFIEIIRQISDYYSEANK